jgi:hypothetical protein
MDLKTAPEGQLVDLRLRTWGLWQRPDSIGLLFRLPTDPESKKKYEKKGFKFIRAAEENSPNIIIDILEGAKAIAVPKLTCEVCGKECKNLFALTGHKRSHK